MRTAHLLLVACAACSAPRAADAPPAETSSTSTRGTLLVLNKSDATVDLLDPDSGAKLATLPTGVGPHEAAISADGRTGLVCNYGAQEPGSTLTVIDVPSRKVLRTIDLGELRRPHGVRFEDGSRYALVTVEQDRAIARVDVSEGIVLDVLPTDQAVSHMVATSPDRSRAFVANIGSGSVTALDLKTGKVLAQITTGRGTEAIAVSPDGREVWAGNREANTLSVIDARSLELVATLPCGTFPIRLEFTPDGRHVLVSNAQSGDVAVFDAVARNEERRIPMKVAASEDGAGRLFGEQFGESPVPVGILIRPDGKRAFVANTNADCITVLDLESWTVAGRLATGREPDGMAWSVLAPAP